MKVVLAAVLLSVGSVGLGLSGLGLSGLGSEAIAATKSLVAPTEITETTTNQPKITEPQKTELVMVKPVDASVQPGINSGLQESVSQDRPTVLIHQSGSSSVINQSGSNFGTVKQSATQSIPAKDQFSQEPDPIRRNLPESAPVLLESRSSGCSASDRNLESVQANLCDQPRELLPKAESQTNYGQQPHGQSSGLIGDPNQSYGSYQFSGIRATVRPLVRPLIKPAPVWTKIALPFNWSISLPLNLAQNLNPSLSPNLGQNLNQNLPGDRQMTFPLSVPAIISSSFGYRIHPISGAERFHQGTDIAAAEGTPVLAAYSGKVEISGWLGGLGLAVIISHEGDRETRYGHLSELFVQPGAWVEQGTAIGLVGSTGMSTGPHLHFELWQKQLGEWVATDPSPYLNIALAQLNRFLAHELSERSAERSIKQSKSNPA